MRIARHTGVGVCPLLGCAEHPLLEEEHLRRGVAEVAAGLDPTRDRVALHLAVVRGGEQRHHRVTVGQDVVGSRLDATPAHAQGCVRGDAADQVAAGESCRLGGEPVDTEDLGGIAHVELTRKLGVGFAVHQVVHPGPVESNATRPLTPSGEEILGSSDLVLALPGVERGHLPAACRLDGHRPRRCVDLLRSSRELVALRLRDANDGEVPLAVDHGRDPQFSHEAVAPLRLCDRAGRGSVTVHGLAVQLPPGAVGPLRPVGHRQVGVQLWIDRDSAGGRIGYGTRGAVHELGHHQVRAHRFGALALGVELPGPAGVCLEVLGSGAHALVMDAQDGCASVVVSERVEDAHVLGCRHGDVERDHVLARPVASEVLRGGRVLATEDSGEIGVGHLAAQPKGLRPGSMPAARRLATGGVVLELLIGHGLAQVADRLLDAGEFADGDHASERTGKVLTDRLHFGSKTGSKPQVKVCVRYRRGAVLQGCGGRS